jgi:hypothetical protein
LILEQHSLKQPSSLESYDPTTRIGTIFDPAKGQMRRVRFLGWKVFVTNENEAPKAAEWACVVRLKDSAMCVTVIVLPELEDLSIAEG